MPFLLETSRLLLCAFDDRHTVLFAQYRSDPEVARYQSWDTPFSLDQAARFVQEMHALEPGKPGQWYQVAIELRATAEMIGDCVFHRLAEDPAQAEIGFTLDRRYQGQGYATEAIHRLLAYLFDELCLHRVRANCDPANAASKRLLERLGFRHEGWFIESLWLKGKWVDEDWYALLKREWEQYAHT